MKKNYSMFKALLFSASLAFIVFGCEKAKNELADENYSSGMKKSAPAFETRGAGTNYTIPNIFDASGLLSAPAGEYNTQPLGSPMELWMGVGNETAGTLVGYVTFLSSPDKVKIDLTDIDGVPGPDFFPYVVTTAHIHFAQDVNGIPHTKNGNPIPGQFEYNVPVDPSQSVIEIPVEFDAVGAIHLSVVKYGGVEGFNFYLPNNQVTLRITDYPSAGDPSYFKMQVTSGGYISTYDMGYGPGIYEGWCIDLDHTIQINADYSAYLYSSYETLPGWMVGAGFIENPENLDKVNYLVNNFAAGQIVQPLDVNCNPVRSPEALTFSDIQRAIWKYVDDNQSESGLQNWSQERVNAILCHVNAKGDGFVPGCDQKIVFLVVPTGTNTTSYNVQIVIGQPVIGQIQVPCKTMGGTAWGDGKFGAGFPGARQWGTYFLRNE